MSDKIVTHEDLDLLREMREQADYGRIHQAPILDRLIAAAEADQPPLPKGWVLYTYLDGAQTVLWHSDGTLSRYSDGSGEAVQVEHPDRLTPLRPTVTEAEIERAALCYYEEGDSVSDKWPDYASDDSKAECRTAVRAILAAAGVIE